LKAKAESSLWHSDVESYVLNLLGGKR